MTGYNCEGCPAQGDSLNRAPDGSRWCDGCFRKLETPSLLAKNLADAFEDESVALSILGGDKDRLPDLRVASIGQEVFIDTGLNVFRLRVTRTRAFPNQSPPP